MRLLADILDDEENTFIASSEDVQFEVEAIVTSTWDKHANVDFKIKNTGNETIHNWYFSFVLNYEIENIWNATIYDTNSEMGLYTIKNSDYNQEIRVNEEIIVGMTLVSDEEIDADNLISKWYLNTKEEQLDNSKFDVSYTEYSAWDSGFNGAITITNKTIETIKNWTLEFRSSSIISVVNQAVLLDSNEKNYVITNDGFNTNISGNSSISFGIQGVKASESFDISEVVLNYYTVNIGLKEDKDGNGVLDIVELLDIGDNSPESTITPEQTPEVTPTVEVPTDVTITPEATVDTIPEITEVVTPELTVDVTPEVTPTIEEIDYELDSDGDGLPDYYEDLIYTDKNNPDSDGDGIGDFLELCIECNPLLVDSDNNGVNDGDEDYDGDGLTNVYEYMNNLNLQKNDSDGDGLGDYEEIYIYGTSPINFDTDSDGVSDYDELEIGKNPLSSQDGEERIYQSKIQDIVNEDDESIVKVEVELSLCGNIETELKIYDLFNVDMYQTSAVGRIGSPISFECEEEFDTAKVTFYYDEEALGDTREEDLIVLWYDETNNCYIEQEQATVDEENNTITLELEHFSTYIVANGLVRLELPLINSITMNMSTSNVDYIIAVDLSKGITAECRDEAIDIIEEIAYSSFNEGDRMYIFYYGSSNVAFTESKMTTYQEIDEYLKQVRNYIGNYEIEEAYGSFVTAAKGAAIVANSFLDVGNSREFIIITNDNDPAVSRSDFFSYVNAFYMNVTVAIVDNSSIWGAMFLGDIYFYNGTCTFDESFGGNNRDTIVSYPDSIDLITDNDGDEIPDYFEINGMLGIDGNIYYSNTSEKDSDDDSINDNLEMGILYLVHRNQNGVLYITDMNQNVLNAGIDISYTKYSKLQSLAPKYENQINYVYDVKSNPSMPDTDGDKVPDAKDELPMIGNKSILMLDISVDMLNIEDTYVGGDQAWFAELPSSTFDEQAYKNACCGTVCGADIMAYYSLHGYPSLYAYPTFEQSNYLNHMYDVLEYVMPSSPVSIELVGFDSSGDPIYSTKSMVDIIRENGEPYNIFGQDFYGYIGVLPWNLDEAVEEFAKSRGVTIHSNVYKETDLLFKNDLICGIKEDIESGTPIALNIASASEISMFNIINCFNRELADARVSAHWVTIVGVEVDDKNRDAFIVVSWGYLYKIYVDDLLNANSINTFVTFEL